MEIGRSAVVLSAEEEEKRKKRLARNRESARECRRRKKAKQMTLKQQIAHIEADNLQLRLKLQMESEAVKFDDERAQSTSRLGSMVTAGVDNVIIEQELAAYKERYSDYGRDRRSAIDFHIAQLRKMLQPTQTTQVFMWIVNSAADLQRLGSGPSDAGQKQQQITELWASLMDELKVTREQVRQFGALLGEDKRFTELQSVSEVSDGMLERLAGLVSNKNESLDQEMAEIQRILSATQIAKFILWIDQNPACMQMLEALWPHLSAASKKDSTNEEETEAEVE